MKSTYADVRPRDSYPTAFNAVRALHFFKLACE
jgi:hypothetical protein